MNLLHCCFAAMFVASVTGAAVDVEKTVKQVQSILKGNSLLPRLSRDEILELLNDIRAEDAKSISASKEDKTQEITTTSPSSMENEINPATQQPNINENIIIKSNENVYSASEPTKYDSTTKPPGPSVMVVLPYTPRDGSSLQELYTRPPRVERVPLAEVTPKSVKSLSSSKLQETLTQNAKLAEKQKQEFPAELQAFLDAHGLTGKPGKDHFLLPLEGFKPLPPPRVVDGTIQLPENILLAYDLISPNDKEINNNEGAVLPPNNFLYEPLRPEFPFELDTSPSETKEQIYPFDMPNNRKPKSDDPLAQNYAPIDYESVKVIPLPLSKGVSPEEDFNINSYNDQNKRQTNSSSEEATSKEQVTTTTTTEEPKSASSETPVDSASADTDAGASIADLEDSFGGPLPDVPGDSELPPPRKNGFYWMVDWNSFLEVGDGDTKVNIRFEPKLGDPQMFLPVSVP